LAQRLLSIELDDAQKDIAHELQLRRAVANRLAAAGMNRSSERELARCRLLEGVEY
jgi:hypothetical protein